MKKYWTLLLIISIGASCQNKENKTDLKPKKSDITESVYASVKITPEVSYFSQPVRPGTIDSIFVNEGELVEKDQILFKISPNSDFTGQLTNAEINLKEAKSNYLGQNNLLNNIELEIQTTEDQLRLDSINLKRQERLLAENIGTRVDFDQITLRYENSKNKLEILKQKYTQTKTTLRSNYNKAINQNNTSKNGLDDFTIKSKIDGKIYSINKEEGDFISAQEKFAEIGSNESFKIEMDLDEVDITKIALGDSVLIILDAYVDEVFLANVIKIYPKKNETTQTFRVESIFSQQPKKLYYGLAGEANIIVSVRKNAIVIPTDYLLPNNKVMTPDGEQSVTLGMKNLEFVEILSGIDTTTTIIKPEE